MGAGTDLLWSPSAGSRGSDSRRMGLYNLQLYAGSWGATWARTNSRGGCCGSNPASVKSVRLRAQWDGGGANTEHFWEPLLCSSAVLPCHAFPLRGLRTFIVMEKVSNTINYFPQTESLITANDAVKPLVSSEAKKVTEGWAPSWWRAHLCFLSWHLKPIKHYKCVRLIFVELETQRMATHHSWRDRARKTALLSSALSCDFGDLIFKYSIPMLIFSSYQAWNWIIQMQQVQSVVTNTEIIDLEPKWCNPMRHAVQKLSFCTLNMPDKATYSFNSIFLRS